MSGRGATRVRPMSAKPAARRDVGGGGPPRQEPKPSRQDFAPSESEDDDSLVVDDDEESEDDENDFSAKFDRVARAKPTDLTNRAGGRFRPASAPAVRAKPMAAAAAGRDVNPAEAREKARAAAATSLSYLRKAAEKKKERDREFALELQREESEYRKKIAQKIEQANKMVSAAGGGRSFAAAPTREGAHMIRVKDPPRGDRIMSVEAFLREFEKLASIPLGQALPAPATSGHIAAGKSTARSSKNLAVGPPQQSGRGRSAAAVRPPAVDADDTDDRTQSSAAGAVAAPKLADRSLVQEELKSVLAGTIALTKVLQDQLHELKLKGWNVSSRAT